MFLRRNNLSISLLTVSWRMAFPIVKDAIGVWPNRAKRNLRMRRSKERSPDEVFPSLKVFRIGLYLSRSIMYFRRVSMSRRRQVPRTRFGKATIYQLDKQESKKCILSDAPILSGSGVRANHRHLSSNLKVKFIVGVRGV